MARFHIDDPEIDVDALEARVLESIERKRGVRFRDEELEQLRAAHLEPGLRREDLPRGLVEQMAAVRGRLPDVPAPPGPGEASLAQVAVDEQSWRLRVDPPGALYESHAPGLKGRVVRFLRRALRPFYRTTLNLDHVLVQLRNELAERDEQLARQAERAFDLLKGNLDRRVDRTADWAGAHMSATTGTLERRHERELHLLHNLVFELTSARLDLITLRDRLDESSRRVAQLEERQRTLETMLLEESNRPTTDR
jgi:hypothetical protein